MNVGKALTEYLDCNGITQTSLAKRFGVTQSRIQQLVTGKVNFGKKVARQWSDAFGFSYQFLLTGEGNLFDDDERIIKQAEDEIQNPSAIPSDIELIKAKAEIEVLKYQVESLQKKLQESYKENARLAFQLNNK